MKLAPDGTKDSAKALLAVKTLGRDPTGSEVISQDIPAFLKFQSTLKDYPDAATEALRCLANALLLIESARHRFLDPPVNGPDVLVPMLDVGLTSASIPLLLLIYVSRKHRVQTKSSSFLEFSSLPAHQEAPVS